MMPKDLRDKLRREDEIRKEGVIMDGCINFNGYIGPTGYGRKWHQGKMKLAHRVAWEEAFGEIPKGLVIDHLCRNRSCVNVDHMELVTPKENVLRGVGPSAKNKCKDVCPNGHPYTGDNLIVSRKGFRSCRICQNIYRRNVDISGPKVTKTCEWCGIEYEAPNSSRNKHRYCSKSCGAYASAKVRMERRLATLSRKREALAEEKAKADYFSELASRNEASG